MTCVTAPAPVKAPPERAEPPIVGPDTAEGLRTTTCPSCGAGVRPDAPWCSLCYHDLRPAPPTVVAPEPTPAYGGHDPLTAPLLDVLLPAAPVTAPAPEAPAPAVPVAEAPGTAAWPCTRCGTRNALTADICRDCGSSFLGGASDGPALVLPGVGDITKLSRGQRTTLAVALILAVVLPLALVTFLMTAEPAKKTGTPTPVTVSSTTAP